MADVRVTTLSGGETTLTEVSVASCRSRIRGQLFCPGETAYDDARTIWNAMIDRRPGLIIRCADTADVIQAVNFARTHQLPVAVRGGGHNIAGSAVCDGGLMIDLSQMKGIQVDPVNRTARAEPGLTWGEFDRETQACGLATNGGVCSEAGIAGLTLGGGFGWLMRKHGLTSDHLVSTDVVCVDGELRQANAHQNANLFFGIRRAQSNFGVVTSFEYQLHPVGPMVLAGMVLHPLEKGREVLKFYRDYNATSPDEMSAWAALLTSPDGHPMVAILACYIGSLEDGERVVQPLKAFGPPMMDMIQPMPYLQAQSLIDESFPPGRFNHWKSSLLRELNDEAIDTLVKGFSKATSPYSSILIEQLGGAVSRVGKDQPALSLRESPYDLVIMPMWSDRSESEQHIQWGNQLWQAMQPFASQSVYVNYLGNESEDRVRSAYGVGYDQLVRLKNQYDPMNVFRFNQNIRPTV